MSKQRQKFSFGLDNLKMFKERVIPADVASLFYPEW